MRMNRWSDTEHDRLGILLNKIENTVTKKTTACFEPSLDYCVVKIPCWDLKKFMHISKLLSSSTDIGYELA